MNLRKLTTAIYKTLQDEELLRLLYYAPKQSGDNPLDIKKSDIFALTQVKKVEIINNHILTAPNFDSFDKAPISRLIYYAGDSPNNRNNYLYADQQYNFDIYTHYTIQNMDRRLEWISDRINEIFFEKHVEGIGKTKFIRRYPINAPKNYVGYRLIYEFCLQNY